MNARRVHSVLVAGVLDPRRIVQWTNSPDELGKLGIPNSSLDLSAFRKFAGLTMKVRHNGLRLEFPLTWRALAVTGLDIEFFSQYALYRAEHALPLANSSLARARDLFSFMPQWNHGTHVQILVNDLLRHELALATLRAATTAAKPSRRAKKPWIGSTVFKANGETVLQESQFDWQKAAAELSRIEPVLSALETKRHLYCYIRMPQSDSARVLELDDLSFRLLSSLDGHRSVNDVATWLGTRQRALRLSIDALITLNVIAPT